MLDSAQFKKLINLRGSASYTIKRKINKTHFLIWIRFSYAMLQQCDNECVMENRNSPVLEL